MAGACSRDAGGTRGAWAGRSLSAMRITLQAFVTFHTDNCLVRDEARKQFEQAVFDAWVRIGSKTPGVCETSPKLECGMKVEPDAAAFAKSAGLAAQHYGPG